jgi:hypothetical protein
MFAVGAVKGRITRLWVPRSGLQVMIVGSLSAGVGYAIGHIVTTSPAERLGSAARSREVAGKPCEIYARHRRRRMAVPRLFR